MNLGQKYKSIYHIILLWVFLVNLKILHIKKKKLEKNKLGALLVRYKTEGENNELSLKETEKTS